MLCMLRTLSFAGVIMREDSKGNKLCFLRIEAPKDIIDWLRIMSLNESIKLDRNVSRGEVIRNILVKEKTKWERNNK